LYEVSSLPVINFNKGRKAASDAAKIANAISR
jgi:hypothetical protein